MIDSCYVGDVRDGLRAMIASGVRAQTCITSPPYWGLRDYGVAGQIGLEPTIAEYVQTMVAVFRLVRDVLADDGTLWLNLGDSYAAGGRGGGGSYMAERKDAAWQSRSAVNGWRSATDGLKSKDLCGIPWRVAFALQADGWWLRQDIIWSKPNPMPESVTDRCTKAHEYLFLLSKRERYYCDMEAIMEPSVALVPEPTTAGWATGEGPHLSVAHARDKGDARTFRGGGKYVNGRAKTPDIVPRESRGNADAIRAERNRRSVWQIATEPYPDAHFATFPTALVEPCILAGSRTGDIVLDPFMGSGTVAQVAQSLGRRWVGCELNPAYVAMHKTRAAQRGLVLA